jgi:hypothetical protein
LIVSGRMQSPLLAEIIEGVDYRLWRVPFGAWRRLSMTNAGGRSGNFDNKIPPAPSGWNKTIDDLIEEAKSGLRKEIGPPETEWALDYERSLLPPDVRFPREDDVYEALEDIEIIYTTQWAAPFTGGGKAVLKKGERIKVSYCPPDPQPIGASLMPVDYAALEERMVPKLDRDSATYLGFRFSVKTLDLHRKFKLIDL